MATFRLARSGLGARTQFTGPVRGWIQSVQDYRVTVKFGGNRKSGRVGSCLLFRTCSTSAALGFLAFLGVVGSAF